MSNNVLLFRSNRFISDKKLPLVYYIFEISFLFVYEKINYLHTFYVGFFGFNVLWRGSSSLQIKAISRQMTFCRNRKNFFPAVFWQSLSPPIWIKRVIIEGDIDLSLICSQVSYTSMSLLGTYTLEAPFSKECI